MASYLEGAGVTNLAKVFPHPPKITPEGLFVVKGEDPGHSMGTVMYIYLGEHHEKRKSTGGPHSGWKQRDYTTKLVCFTRSVTGKAPDCGIQSDNFLDSLTGVIEAQRTANSNGVIFQWGEGNQGIGSPDIMVEATMPRVVRGQLAQVYSVVTVTTVEMLLS